MKLVPSSETNARDFEPHSGGWRTFAWSGGSVDTASRPSTRSVEGKITLQHPTIISIIEGGCSRLEVVSECGHRYDGSDFAGSVSFIPPACGRHIKMTEVQSKWASLSIRPDLFCMQAEHDENAPVAEVSTFTNHRDVFLHTMLAELHRLQTGDEALNGLYCEAMAVSAAQYLVRRYGRADSWEQRTSSALPRWRLRRIADYVDANLGNPNLRLEDVAQAVGLSSGYLHRAFKAATGETPLAYIQRKRIDRALQLLGSRDISVLEVATQVGFVSPSHFARLFRQRVGVTPSEYRNGRR